LIGYPWWCRGRPHSRPDATLSCDGKELDASNARSREAAVGQP
jgi:hypothetical protein